MSFKRLPKFQVAATEQGLAPMTQFFKPKIKPGRPLKTCRFDGAAQSQEAKVSRQNWSKGDGLKRLTELAAKWELEAAQPEKGR